MPMRMRRERSDSVGDSVDDSIKRKREMLGNGAVAGGEGEGEVFKRSRKINRSPIKRMMNEEREEAFREMRAEMRADMKEGLKEITQEIKKIVEGQSEVMRQELEKMKEELKMREGRWDRERKEMKVRIENLERQMVEWNNRSGKNNGGEEAREGRERGEEGKGVRKRDGREG